jgi:tryptophan synthase beta chain
LLDLYRRFSGRPTPLYYAANLTEQLGGAKVFFKNEGLNHTGAHKINHCLGQALLARRMGKKRIIAETGAGQHGLATATVAAKFGFACTVFMGETDVARQRPNVFWMEQLGAEVVPVTHGTKTLKDAVNAAIKEWITRIEDTHYVIGSCLGPHPYPSMNRDFQSIVGLEVREQLQSYGVERPDLVIACAGGGSNAMGIFNAFLDDPNVHLLAVEAGGLGIETPGGHAARLQGGRVGVVEGYKSYFLQDADGQIQPTHSVSAGLDYAGIGPQLAYMKDEGRIDIDYATDAEVLEAFRTLARTEGILPALESAHAVAKAIQVVPTLSTDQAVVVNLSGRGDKDIFIVAEAMQDDAWKAFVKAKAETY